MRDITKKRMTGRRGVRGAAGLAVILAAAPWAAAAVAPEAGTEVSSGLVELGPQAVSTAERTDGELRAEVLRAFRSNRSLEPSEVRVEATGGVVTLTGRVQSFQERQAAGELARAVPGVRGVRNEIEVEYQVSRLDAEIREDIAEAFLRDPRFRTGAAVRVDVREGRVELSGVVASDAQLHEALEKAWVIGVRAVDVSALETVSAAAEERRARLDEAIEAGVRREFLDQPLVRHQELGVEASNGVVTLSGTVPTLWAREVASRAARRAMAVEGVRNRIEVDPAEHVSGEELSRRIQGAIGNDPLLDADAISVVVEDGVAVLTGSVASPRERDRAREYAARAEGVLAIEDRLSVRGGKTAG